MAAIDPGGNWANRPINSITDILLPWHPQTVADIQMRKVAMGALIREQSDIAWKVLLSLLPSSHSTTSGTHKPEWRDYVPNDWKDTVTHGEYDQQVAIYSEFVTSEAKKNLARLPELIDNLTNLRKQGFDEALSYLESKTVTGLPPERRLPIWEKLVDLVGEHKRFSDARWAMPELVRKKVEVVAHKLEPTDPLLTERRLFSSNDVDLFEEVGNYKEQEKRLWEKRKAAIQKIMDIGGVDSVLNFLQVVESSDRVGVALALLEISDIDSKILPKLLGSDSRSIVNFVAGYVCRRFYSTDWGWVDSFLEKDWTENQRLAFLLLIPFGRLTWERAERLLPNNIDEYWQKADAWRVDDEADMSDAAKKLVANGRPCAGIDVLGQMKHRKIELESDIVFEALEKQLTSKEQSMSFRQYETLDLIKWLQENVGVDQDRLARLEWSYLPALGSQRGAQPKTLGTFLSNNPSFYCEVIRTIFKSKKKDKKEEVTESRKKKAEHAYQLLQEWRQVPGKNGDDFDSEGFSRWVAEVKKSCRESGHLEMALHMLGQVLTYAPADPSGLWIHQVIAQTLDDVDAEEIRSGFRIRTFNRRGVHGFTSGKAELDIAQKYQKQAEALENEGFARFAATMRDLAKSYEKDAEREAKRNPYED